MPTRLMGKKLSAQIARTIQGDRRWLDGSCVSVFSSPLSCTAPVCWPGQLSVLVQNCDAIVGLTKAARLPQLGIHARTTALNAWVSASVNGAKFVAASTSPRLCESCEDKTGHHECDRHVVERDKQSGWYERP